MTNELKQKLDEIRARHQDRKEVLQRMAADDEAGFVNALMEQGYGLNRTEEGSIALVTPKGDTVSNFDSVDDIRKAFM